VIISVGYRVKSHRGTQFRIWATQRLKEYIVKGFVMDDRRLAGGATNYFDELIERVRRIRTSERNFYEKVRDIFATSIDYDPKTDYARQFYATVQNKFHYAIHGRTAAELRTIEKKPMYMSDWVKKLDEFLILNEKEILTHTGKVSHKEMEAKVRDELEKYNELAQRKQIEGPK
jgi:hypothetical protein